MKAGKASDTAAPTTAAPTAAPTTATATSTIASATATLKKSHKGQPDPTLHSTPDLSDTASASLSPEHHLLLDYAGALYPFTSPSNRIKWLLVHHLVLHQPQGPLGPLSLTETQLAKLSSCLCPWEWELVKEPKLRSLFHNDPTWSLATARGKGEGHVRLLPSKLAVVAKERGLRGTLLQLCWQEQDPGCADADAAFTQSGVLARAASWVYGDGTPAGRVKLALLGRLNHKQPEGPLGALSMSYADVAVTAHKLCREGWEQVPEPKLEHLFSGDTNWRRGEDEEGHPCVQLLPEVVVEQAEAQLWEQEMVEEGLELTQGELDWIYEPYAEPGLATPFMPQPQQLLPQHFWDGHHYPHYQCGLTPVTQPPYPVYGGASWPGYTYPATYPAPHHGGFELYEDYDLDAYGTDEGVDPADSNSHAASSEDESTASEHRLTSPCLGLPQVQKLHTQVAGSSCAAQASPAAPATPAAPTPTPAAAQSGDSSEPSDSDAGSCTAGRGHAGSASNDVHGDQWSRFVGVDSILGLVRKSGTHNSTTSPKSQPQSQPAVTHTAASEASKPRWLQALSSNRGSPPGPHLPSTGGLAGRSAPGARAVNPGARSQVVVDPADPAQFPALTEGQGTPPRHVSATPPMAVPPGAFSYAASLAKSAPPSQARAARSPSTVAASTSLAAHSPNSDHKSLHRPSSPLKQPGQRGTWSGPAGRAAHMQWPQTRCYPDSRLPDLLRAAAHVYAGNSPEAFLKLGLIRRLVNHAETGHTDQFFTSQQSFLKWARDSDWARNVAPVKEPDFRRIFECDPAWALLTQNTVFGVQLLPWGLLMADSSNRTAAGGAEDGGAWAEAGLLRGAAAVWYQDKRRAHVDPHPPLKRVLVELVARQAEDAGREHHGQLFTLAAKDIKKRCHKRLKDMGVVHVRGLFEHDACWVWHDKKAEGRDAAELRPHVLYTGAWDRGWDGRPAAAPAPATGAAAPIATGAGAELITVEDGCAQDSQPQSGAATADAEVAADENGLPDVKARLQQKLEKAAENLFFGFAPRLELHRLMACALAGAWDGPNGHHSLCHSKFGPLLKGTHEWYKLAKPKVDNGLQKQKVIVMRVVGCGHCDSHAVVLDPLALLAAPGAMAEPGDAQAYADADAAGLLGASAAPAGAAASAAASTADAADTMRTPPILPPSAGDVTAVWGTATMDTCGSGDVTVEELMGLLGV